VYAKLYKKSDYAKPLIVFLKNAVGIPLAFSGITPPEIAQ